ncbi:hypothetical protein CHUAL_008011 [Chamberlinius hualienensis]
MAPTTTRKLNSEIDHLSTSLLDGNVNYFRKMSNCKRRRSFKDTLRKTKQRIIDLKKENNNNNTGKDSIVWQAFQSRNSKEFDLEQKIDLEIKMREGTTKLLAACHHPSQSLEAAKSLLMSNERMTAYLDELQRRKTEKHKLQENDINLSTDTGMQQPRCSMAKVSVADIRMPLIWKDTDHFKNKGDYRRFAVFCLLRIGTEIYDSLMITQVDRSMTDICFEDNFMFCQVPPDFDFHLEVYSTILHDDLSMASTPCKIKHKINDSLSRTVGRKLAATLKDELASTNLGPKFELVARATLRLDDAEDCITTHDLVIENNENRFNQLPLFGHFCCRLATQPEFLVDDGMSGSIMYQKDLDQNAQRFWSSRRGLQISFWNSAEAANCGRTSAFTITLSKTSSVELIKKSNNLSFVNVKYMEDHVEQNCYMHSSTNEDTKRWFLDIKTAIHNSVMWRHAAEEFMEIQSPVFRRTPLFSLGRKGSLYDETPLKQDSHQVASSVQHKFERKNAQQVAKTVVGKENVQNFRILKLAKMSAERQPYEYRLQKNPKTGITGSKHLLRQVERISKKPKATEVETLLQIEQYMKLMKMTPEQIFRGVLNVDEQIYTDDNFEEIASLLPSKETLKPLTYIPVDQLSDLERLVVLLSKVSYLQEKVLLMKAKKDIEINLLSLKKAIYFSLENVANVSDNSQFKHLTVYVDSAAKNALGIKFPPFSYKRIVKEKLPNGEKFIDSFTNDLLRFQGEKYNSLKNFLHPEKVVDVPAVPELIEKLRQVKRDLKKMKKISKKIIRTPFHPFDRFDKVIRVFIAEKLDERKSLKKSAKKLDDNFNSLCRQYLIPKKSITIGEFFQNVIVLRDAIQESTKRRSEKV